MKIRVIDRLCAWGQVDVTSLLRLYNERLPFENKELRECFVKDSLVLIYES